MPSKRRKGGTLKDIAHPLNNELRRMIEEKINATYEKSTLMQRGGPIRDKRRVETSQ